MYDYHDATLKRIELNWDSGVTTMTIALCAEPTREVIVTMLETSNFNCERQFPWGKSIFVNRLDMQKADCGHRLELEMQSGDKITILEKEVLESTAE